jgi:hypothetical protein
MFEVRRYNGPPDPLAIAEWVRQEFGRLEQSFFDLDMIQLKETFVAPGYAREGMVLFADGTLWNPGAGRGFYGYHTGAWNKLG